RDLVIAVPFLSDLASKRDVVVRPRLAFTLNGSHFDSAAQGTPFAQTRKTDATLKLAGFDVTPYLGYIPADLPVRLKAGVLDADLRLAFEQTTSPSVILSGTLRASHVRVDDAKADELLAFDGLDVALTDLKPFARVVDVASIALTNPKLSARRDANGRINLDLAAPATKAAGAAAPKDLAQEAAKSATKSATKDTEAPQPAAGASAPQSAPAPAEPADAWKVAIAKVAVRGGTVLWTDDSTAPHAQAALHDLELDAASIALPFAKPLQFSGSAALDAPAGSGKAPAAATITFGGSATDRMASVAVNARAIPLAVAAPYLAAYLEPRVDGVLGAQVNLDWKAAGEQPASDKASDKAAKAQSTDAPGALHVGVKTLTLDGVALVESQSARTAPQTKPAKVAKQAKPVAKARATRAPSAADAAALPSVKRIEVTDAQVDLARQTVSVDKLSVTDPHTGVERGADKQWMYQRWIKTAASPAATRKSAATQKSERNHPNAKAVPWQVAIKEIALDGGEVAYRDEAVARPVAFQVSALKLDLKNFVLDGTKPLPLVVSARVGAGRIEPGRLDYHGDVGLAPL
ncbi:MAG: DUF748 domain-containing protein, partial [Proteobacteria bacterium]|nr:DUF748 domain-containing protein [Pseudomonadota bacterium]